MIFDEQISRKPDHYGHIATPLIEAMWNTHWTHREFSFSSDARNYHIDMNDMERRIIINALSAISQVELPVKRWWGSLGNTLPHPSIHDLGITMANIEVIHGRAYEKLLSVLQLEDVFEENLKLDIIAGRVKYLRKYNEKNYSNARKQFVYSLVLFTLFVENVSLFTQFYIITWFNRYRNLLKDTAQQVQYTAKEEALHALAGSQLIQQIRIEHPELFDEELKERIKHEAEEAFKAESKLIKWMLGDFEGEDLSIPVLQEYVKGRINDSLVQIGFDSVFICDESLLKQSTWMETEVLANSMTDFFHKRPIEYSKKNNVFDSESLFA